MTPVDEASTEPTRSVLAALGDVDWPAVGERVRAATADLWYFLRPSGLVPLPVDPVPRVVAGDEWDALAAGLAQRVRALEAFLRAPQDAVRDGVVPAEVVTTSRYAEQEPLPPAVPLGVAGPDLARDADGFVVLEDNLRTPTLMGYAIGVARAVRAELPPPAGLRPAGAGLAEGLARVLRAAAPDVDEPVVAVLGDLRGTNARWEPELVAAMLGVPLVDLDELRPRGDRLLLPDGRAVDVLWRRTSEERLRGDDGRLNRYGEALLPGLRSGRLRVVNPYGTGVADDKRFYRYVEDLVRHALGEEPLLRSVRSWDLGRAADLREVRDRLDQLVVKPRGGSGGYGVTVLPHADPRTRDDVLRRVREDPAGWLAQEPVALSTCPALVDGALVPRHVDLRPCVLSDGASVTVLPGGLTRAALTEGQLVVNVAQGGAGKDTWVVDVSR